MYWVDYDLNLESYVYGHFMFIKLVVPAGIYLMGQQGQRDQK